MSPGEPGVDLPVYAGARGWNGQVVCKVITTKIPTAKGVFSSAPPPSKFGGSLLDPPSGRRPAVGGFRDYLKYTSLRSVSNSWA